MHSSSKHRQGARRMSRRLRHHRYYRLKPSSFIPTIEPLPVDEVGELNQAPKNKKNTRDVPQTLDCNQDCCPYSFKFDPIVSLEATVTVIYNELKEYPCLRISFFICMICVYLNFIPPPLYYRHILSHIESLSEHAEILQFFLRCYPFLIVWMFLAMMNRRFVSRKQGSSYPHKQKPLTKSHSSEDSVHTCDTTSSHLSAESNIEIISTESPETCSRHVIHLSHPPTLVSIDSLHPLQSRKELNMYENEYGYFMDFPEK